MTQPPRLANSCFKEDIKSPGGYKRHKKPVSNKAIGTAAEELAIDEMCEQLGKVRTTSDRRQNQAVAGGDLGIPDFDIKELEGCCGESKCGKFYYADFWGQIFENTPNGVIPYLIYREAVGTPSFLMLQTKDLMKFIRRLLSAAAAVREENERVSNGTN